MKKKYYLFNQLSSNITVKEARTNQQIRTRAVTQHSSDYSQFAYHVFWSIFFSFSTFYFHRNGCCFQHKFFSMYLFLCKPFHKNKQGPPSQISNSWNNIIWIPPFTNSQKNIESVSTSFQNGITSQLPHLNLRIAIVINVKKYQWCQAKKTNKWT